jgi:tetratricopeptide (TPR) repeat protein
MANEISGTEEMYPGEYFPSEKKKQSRFVFFKAVHTKSGKLNNRLAKTWIFSNKRWANLISWFVKLFFIVIAYHLSVDVHNRIKENKQKYFLSTFSVPKQMLDNGITGETIKSMIFKNIAAIDSSASAYKFQIYHDEQFSTQIALEIEKDDDLEYSGVSYHSLIKFLSNIFQPRKFIKGEFVFNGENDVNLLINIPKLKYSQWVGDDDSLNIGDKAYFLSCLAADIVVQKINPVQYALYKAQQTDYSGAIEYSNQKINEPISKKQKGLLYTVIGDSYGWLGKDSLAIEALKNSIKEGQSTSFNYGLLAHYLSRSKQYDSAKKYIDILEEKTQRDTSSKFINFTKGSFYVYAKKYDSAIFCYKKHLELNNDEAYSYTNLAASFALIKNFDSSSKYLDYYISHFPDRYLDHRTPLYASLGFYTDSSELQALIGAARHLVDTNKYVAYRIGLFHFDQQKLDSARYYLNKAVSIDKNFCEALFLIATIDITEQNYLEANESFQRIFDVNGFNEDVFQSWALSMYYQGASDLALEKIGMTYRSSETYSLTGLIQTGRKSFLSANFHYKMSYLINPSNVENLYRYSLYWYNQFNYEKSISFSNRSLEIDSNHIGALRNIALCNYAMNRFVDVKKICNKILSIGEDPEAYNLLGRLQLHSMNHSEAEKLYKKVLQLDSTHPIALYFLADYYTDTERFGTAIPYWYKLEKSRSLLSFEYLSLGVCLFNVRQINKAISMYKKALAIEPNNCVALDNWRNCLLALNRNPFMDFSYRSAAVSSDCIANELHYKQYPN